MAGVPADYISESERRFWLQHRESMGQDGILDQVVFFHVALNGQIRSAEDLAALQGPKSVANLYVALTDDWNSDEKDIIKSSLSRLEGVGLLEVRDGIYHVKNGVRRKTAS